jgi:uncharacterized protein (TIGR02466 family)
MSSPDRERDVQPSAALHSVLESLAADARRALVDEGDPRRARDCLRVALVHAERELATADPAFVPLRRALGAALHAAGDLGAAGVQYEAALEGARRLFGEDHAETARCLNDYGQLLQTQGRVEEARGCYERALRTVQSGGERQRLDAATCINNLGRLFHDLGQLPATLPYYQRSLNIREDALGSAHPVTAESVNNVGTALDSIGDLEGAQRCLAAALAVVEAARGQDHPERAQILNNLGRVAGACGRHAEAIAHYRESLRIFRLRLGARHILCGQVSNNLGLACENALDLEAARTAYEEAIAIFDERLGPAHSNTAVAVSNLGCLLQRLGDNAAAEAAHARALAIRRRSLGDEHPVTAQSVSNYAIVLQMMGRHAEALALHREALANFERTRGPTHAETARGHNNIGSCLNALGLTGQALQAFQQAVAAFRVSAPAHPSLAQALDNCGAMLALQDRLDEAADASREACSILQQAAAGGDHPNLAANLNNLGLIELARGNDVEAMLLLERAQAMFERTVPAEDAALLRLRELRHELEQEREAGRCSRRGGMKLPGPGPAADGGTVRMTMPAAEDADQRAERLLEWALTSQASTVLAELDPEMRADQPDPRLWRAYGIALGMVQRLAEGASALRQSLERAPGDTWSRAYLGVLLHALGRPAEADEWFERHELLYEGALLPPAAPAVERDALLDALAAHVCAHPSLTWNAPFKATIEGWQTDDILPDAVPAVRRLRELLVRHVEAVLEVGHEGAAETAMRGLHLKAWGVVLERGGRQAPHVHPAAVLSGVCYLEVPPLPDHEGWLCFRRTLPWIRCAEAVGGDVSRVAQPERGKLVVFPSHFWHETLPFSAAGRRVSIAFDVLPSAP